MSELCWLGDLTDFGPMRFVPAHDAEKGRMLDAEKVRMLNDSLAEMRNAGSLIVPLPCCPCSSTPKKIPAPEKDGPAANLSARAPGVFLSTEEALDAWRAPSLPPPLSNDKIPLSRMTVEQRLKWDQRKEEIMRAFEATFTPETPAVQTVVRPWAKVAAAVLVFVAAAVARVWLFRRFGATFLALLVVLSFGGCCTCAKRAAVIAREYDSVRKRLEPAETLSASQRAKVMVDEDVLAGDIADLASGR